MSINPVSVIGSVSDRSAEAAQPRPAERISARAGENVAAADSGHTPKQNAPRRAEPSVSDQIPEDEVEVQQDNQTNGRIVIKYKDHTGHVILQVPTAQLLNLARAIYEQFQRDAVERHNGSVSTTAVEGDKTNGH